MLFDIAVTPRSRPKDSEHGPANAMMSAEKRKSTMYNPHTLAASHGTLRMSRIPRSSSFTRSLLDHRSVRRQSATGTICAVPCGLWWRSWRNSGPYRDGLSEEFDWGCFLCEIDECDDDSEGAVSIPRELSASEVGDSGTRNNAGGGTFADKSGVKIDRHFVEDGVVTTEN